MSLKTTEGDILTLKSMTATVFLNETLAQVTLQQIYNNSLDKTVNCVYRLPLDNKAAVQCMLCSAGGQEFKAVLKGNEEAQQIYLTAVSQGDTAVYARKQEDDIFVVMVGGIVKDQEVSVKVVYSTPVQLTGRSVRFFLPTTIGPRYTLAAKQNMHVPEAYSSGSHYKLNFVMQCYMSSPIVKVMSRSHGAHMEATMSGTRALVVASELDMDRDLYILVETAKPDMMNVQKGYLSSIDSYAIQLAVTPQFNVSERACEVIFIVDRSGSMMGAQMIQAQKALHLFLRSLPVGSYFNIIGFGSHHRQLFPNGSVAYTDETLRIATEHVDTMRADLGGTEILEPLKKAFSAPRVGELHRVVFLLTDGQVANTREVLRYVGITCGDGSINTAFAMGVGMSPSHQLVEGIAREGSGTAAFVTSTDQAELSVAVIEQLRHATQYALTNLVITWHYEDDFSDKGANSNSNDGSVKPVSYYSDGASAMDTASDALSSTSIVSTTQAIARTWGAPFNPPARLYSGEREHFYCVLGSGQKPPRWVELRAQMPTGEIRHKVEVPSDITVKNDLVHAMAARRLISELEDPEACRKTMGKNWTMPSVAPTPSDIKRAIIATSTTLQVPSKHTSLVAVLERTNAERQDALAADRASIVIPSMVSPQQPVHASVHLPVSAVSHSNLASGPSGAQATSMGSRPVGMGARPTAMGARPTAMGARPTAMGARPTAMGARPTAMGARPTAMGARPTAMGARPMGIAMGAKNPRLAGASARPQAMGASPRAFQAMGATRMAAARSMGSDDEDEDDDDEEEDDDVEEEDDDDDDDDDAMDTSADLTPSPAPAPASAPFPAPILPPSRPAQAGQQELSALIREQNMDGSFRPSLQMFRLCGASPEKQELIAREISQSSVVPPTVDPRTLSATLVALVFMEECMEALEAQWRLVAAKAHKWCGSVAPSGTGELLEAVRAVLF